MSITFINRYRLPVALLLFAQILYANIEMGSQGITFLRITLTNSTLISFSEGLTSLTGAPMMHAVANAMAYTPLVIVLVVSLGISLLAVNALFDVIVTVCIVISNAIHSSKILKPTLANFVADMVLPFAVVVALLYLSVGAHSPFAVLSDLGFGV